MTNQLPEIAQAMLEPSFYPEKPDKVDLMQTQMSFIFIAGKYVYKLKKPVNLGYLDYSSLEKRRYFCEQEVELNRRLSPEVYLGVVPLYKNEGRYSFAEDGEIADYTVKMMYLPQDRMLDVLLRKSSVTEEMMEQVAAKMADFHSRAATDEEIGSFGKLDAIKVNTDENFDQTEKYIGKIITKEQYDHIKEYTDRMLEENPELFKDRVDKGRIKDCHGDLHAAHICFTNGISIYDCIEFNDRFRYCDTASEIAFLAMDLDHFGRADLSRAFVKSYIEHSRDEQMKNLLKFYKCYRAYVRGKVGCFKSDDPYIGEQERQQNIESTKSYFELADMYVRRHPVLFITTGLVGSGKSTLADNLAKRSGAAVISSDVVRKRLAEVPLNEHHYGEMDTGIYSSDFSEKTYGKMYSDAEEILTDGDSVILDATFSRKQDRERAEAIAGKTGADFYILECRLDEETTRKRLDERGKKVSVSDGRWEIYVKQKDKYEPVSGSESNHFVIDTAGSLKEQIDKIIEAVG
jgi:uncharacterized protein